MEIAHRVLLLIVFDKIRTLTTAYPVLDTGGQEPVSLRRGTFLRLPSCETVNIRWSVRSWIEQSSRLVIPSPPDLFHALGGL